MSARGTLGGLSTATADAVKALDAFGKDKIIVETVGAGQNEIDVVKTADTVAVLVPPGSGDDVQMLKAGILEIADCFVVNKADLEGADRTVQQLREMLEVGRDVGPAPTGHHGPEASAGDATADADGEGGDEGDGAGESGWRPPIIETVATRGEGLEAFMDALAAHREHIEASGQLADLERTRYAEEIRTLLREDLGDLLAEEIERRGGLDRYVEQVRDRETDPYAVADEVLEPLIDCVERQRE
jgi:LAO/AO transport system kinase